MQSGADAVYLGLKRFSARANAMNFDFDELKQVVEQSRRFFMKVYLALNTLAFDDELDLIREYINNSVKCGVDAVIVQDLAVAAIVREAGLPIHASTQMTCTTVTGAKKLKELGFTRVVLARELSRDEIRRITAEGGIETEIFVHGAHCASVSGQCYLSSFWGGRSGNRGNCAQPCRLDFQAGEQGYALSLKDLSLIKHIAELREMGVKSLKIEGRMKRPEYVAAAVHACRSALAGQVSDVGLLQDVFSRSGFTDGYYIGDYDDMQGTRTKEDVLATSSALEQIRALFKTPVKRYKIDFRVQVKADSMTCTATVGDVSVTVIGDLLPEKADNRGISEEFVILQMSKLGGTIFSAGRVDVELEPDLFVSSKSMNELRRKAIESVIEKYDKSP